MEDGSIDTLLIVDRGTLRMLLFTISFVSVLASLLEYKTFNDDIPAFYTRMADNCKLFESGSMSVLV